MALSCRSVCDIFLLVSCKMEEIIHESYKGETVELLLTHFSKVDMSKGSDPTYQYNIDNNAF